MIEQLSDMPEGVLGMRFWGKVSAEDYENVFLPEIQKFIDDGREIRFVIQIGPEFDSFEAGAMWDDTKMAVRLGIGHYSAWKRVALVTDVEWIRHMSSFFGWLKFFPLEVFALEKLEEAKGWAAG